MLLAYQTRNMLLILIAVAILIYLQSIVIAFGAGFYLGYFYAVLLLGGFFGFHYIDVGDGQSRINWSLLIASILVLISQVAVHIISKSSLWGDHYEVFEISLHLIRGAIIVGSLVGRRYDRGY